MFTQQMSNSIAKPQSHLNKRPASLCNTKHQHLIYNNKLENANIPIASSTLCTNRIMAIRSKNHDRV